MNPAIQKLVYAAALDRFARLDPATLPRLASEALLEGVDSESIARLAGDDERSPPMDLRDSFAAALAELGIAPLSLQDAALVVARALARDISSGRSEPAAAFRWLDELDDALEGVACDPAIAALLELRYGHDEIDYLLPESRAYKTGVERLDAEVLAACRRINAGELCERSARR